MSTTCSHGMMAQRRKKQFILHHSSSQLIYLPSPSALVDVSVYEATLNQQYLHILGLKIVQDWFYGNCNIRLTSVCNCTVAVGV